MKFYHKTSFWKKLEATFGMLGAATVTGMGVEEVSSVWFVVIGICGIIAKLIFVWIEDHDDNGIVDLFE
jgi:hypothetical protein